jgi:hypothetical protein
MTIERLTIADFMAVPRQYLRPNAESNIIVSFANIAARKSPPIN